MLLVGLLSSTHSTQNQTITPGLFYDPEIPETISFSGFSVVDILEPTRLALTRFRDTTLRIMGKTQYENCGTTCNNEYKAFPNFTKTAELLKA